MLWFERGKFFLRNIDFGFRKDKLFADFGVNAWDSCLPNGKQIEMLNRVMIFRKNFGRSVENFCDFSRNLLCFSLNSYSNIVSVQVYAQNSSYHSV